MNPAEFESKLRSDGFDEVLNRELTAGESNTEHAHPFEVRALVLAGEIRLTCDGAERVYREGDVFVMAAGKAHHERVGPAGVRYIAGRRHHA
jgi:quercetin dioxygenase-like cupin family protein